MAFDGFFTRAIIQELKQSLIGGRVSKIYQPYEQEIHIVIRNHRKNCRLHASIHPVYYRIHLTEERPNNPKQAPLFAMLLRKHLENAHVLAIEQIENDRILYIELSGRDELGDLHNYRLYIELMGRHSNIVLVSPEQDNKIIDCIKHVPSHLNSHRLLLPGATYKLPPQQDAQVNLFNLSQDKLNVFVKEHHTAITDGKAYQHIQGLGKEASDHLNIQITNNSFEPVDAIQQLMNASEHPHPVSHQHDQKLSYYFTELAQWEGKVTPYPSLSELVDTYYHHKVHQDRLKQVSGDLIHKLEQIRKKNETKLKKLKKDYQKAEKASEYQLKGELLNAYMYQINKGDTVAKVTNYYTNESIDIELDPKLTPNENSQRYFKKYTKYRDSLKYIKHQIRLAEDENSYLESTIVQLEQADIEDLEDIRQELADEGYSFKKKNNHKERHQQKSKPRQFKASDGTPIFVGRNNKQNDELALKKASKNHWWFHTKNIPGSHVIVQSDNPSEQTKQEAAMLAAYYSKSRQSANVPVDTVQVKSLRKPNGAKPGYVIYEGQETLYVTPSEAMVKQLQ